MFVTVWLCTNWAFADSSSSVSAGGKAHAPARSVVVKETESDFPIGKLRLGGKVYKVEIAERNDLRTRGLMFRTDWPFADAMLFIFENEQPLSFWTKNTFLPLSIGYFDAKQRLVDVQDMTPVKSEMEEPTTYPSKRPAKYALEVPQGFFKKNKIEIGARFELIHTAK